LRVVSFGGYGLALAALALVVFGAYDSYPLAWLNRASFPVVQRMGKVTATHEDEAMF